MSLNAIGFLVIYCLGFLLAIVADPSYGMFTYIFEYYHHPPLWWWGRGLPYIRWALFISIAMFIGYFLRFGNYSRSFFSAPPAKWFLLFLIPVWLVTSLFAVDKGISSARAIDHTNLVVLCFLIATVIHTPRQYELFVWTHLIGAFRWGWTMYRDPSSGRLERFGGADSFGSNHLAAHLLTVPPFLGIRLLTSSKRWERLACLLIVPFVVNLIILTNSRGALVAMVFQGLAAIFLSRGVLRFKALLGLVLGAGLFLYLADENFLTRQQTTFKYKEESAAQGRMAFWKTAWRMTNDYPLGLGEGGFSLTAYEYDPKHEGRSVHNTYLQISTSWGYCGLLLFFAEFGSVFLMLHRIRRQHPHTGQTSRVHYEALAIEVGLIGRFVAAMFGSNMSHESFYWLASLAMTLYNGALTDGKATNENTPDEKQDQSQQPARSGLTQWRIQQKIRKAQKTTRS